jgi:dienelactone hydrolase
MTSRRKFLQWAGAALGYPALAASAAGALEAELSATAAQGEPAAAGLANASSSRTGSDVGSLFPFIDKQAVKGDFPLSFLRERFTDLSAWKRQARGRLLELLYYLPAPCEPRAEVVERQDRVDHLREKIYFQTTSDLRVPAYVLIPKKGSPPYPGVVALHDHGGFSFWGKEKLVETEDEHPVLTEFKKRSYAGRSIATTLVRRGYVVLVIDMFYWGERRMLLDDDPADWRDRPRDIKADRIAAFNRRASENEQLVGRTIFTAGFTWPGVMLWDDVRSVDYLVTRPEVNPKRIACVGLSVGGFRSCHLAALDDRIKAAVVVGWMASFPKQLRHHIRHTIGHTMLIPGLYRELDYPDVASLAMPAALLVINGSKDELFELDGVRSCFDKLQACYKKAGVPARVRTHLYDAPHEFNDQMQAEAWEWLAKWV